jgi:hypothetical protein
VYGRLGRRINEAWRTCCVEEEAMRRLARGVWLSNMADS